MFIDFSIKDLIDILLVAYLLHRYPGIYRYLADCISGFGNETARVYLR